MILHRQRSDLPAPRWCNSTSRNRAASCWDHRFWRGQLCASPFPRQSLTEHAWPGRPLNFEVAHEGRGGSRRSPLPARGDARLAGAPPHRTKSSAVGPARVGTPGTNGRAHRSNAHCDCERFCALHGHSRRGRVAYAFGSPGALGPNTSARGAGIGLAMVSRRAKSHGRVDAEPAADNSNGGQPWPAS